MKLAAPRGPVSATLMETLAQDRRPVPAGLAGGLITAAGPADVLADEDLQLSLFVCYELHYRGWDGVDDRWEWDPDLLRFRAAAERRLEAGLRDLTCGDRPVAPGGVPSALIALVGEDDAPSVSGYLRGRATYEQFREFVTHR